MAISIKNILNLNSLRGFKLEAGEGGLDKVVSLVSVADYEFDPKLAETYQYGFEKESFVISSLLFAKDNPDQITFAIKKLIEIGVSGFAYKKIIYKELPKEALELANKHQFPIFSFEPTSAYFENIIFDIMLAVQENSVSFSQEKIIEQMIEQKLTRNEVEALAKTINPNFQNYSKVCHITKAEGKDYFEISRIIKNYSLVRKPLNSAKVKISTFKGGLMVIVSMNQMDEKKYQVIVSEILDLIGEKDNLMVCHSSVHPTFIELDDALRESYYASLVAHIETKKTINYEDIGTYKFLIAHRNSDAEVRFMRRYVDQFNEEQLATAIAFVLAKGNYDEAAERLICHKNTVRYRLNRIQQKLDPGKTEAEFYENLAVAIKLYLIRTI